MEEDAGLREGLTHLIGQEWLGGQLPDEEVDGVVEQVLIIVQSHLMGDVHIANGSLTLAQITERLGL